MLLLLLLLPLSSNTKTMPSPFPSNRDSNRDRERDRDSKPTRKLTSPFPTNSSAHHQACKHTPSATLDLLILILVFFSCTFLIASAFSYIFRSLSQILPPLSLSFKLHYSVTSADILLIFLTASVVVIAGACCLWRGVEGSNRSAWFRWSRKCDNPRCLGLKKAMEFDVQLQTEECFKKSSSPSDAVWKEIDDLPWKGGEQGKNSDYECIRSELRKMAPPNGRAVLLFRARCGCPVAKLEAWGQRRGRKNKKGMASLALEGEER